LQEPGAENVIESKVVVFDSAEDYHERINDPSLNIDDTTILVMRNAGPIAWPGAAEVVNMQPPDALLQAGTTALPVIGDGRQSGTSDSPSILHASPESALGGGLGWLRTGDVVRIDLNQKSCMVLLPEEEIEARKAAFEPSIPACQTPWQEIYRAHVGGLDSGAVLELAVKYRAVRDVVPRHNH
jgi:dihydroxy-acid dehydratase